MQDLYIQKMQNNSNACYKGLHSCFMANGPYEFIPGLLPLEMRASLKPLKRRLGYIIVLNVLKVSNHILFPYRNKMGPSFFF